MDSYASCTVSYANGRPNAGPNKKYDVVLYVACFGTLYCFHLLCV